MVKIKESAFRQALVDMIEDYTKYGNPDNLQNFVDSMYLQLQYEAVMEYIKQCSVIDRHVYTSFHGKIVDGYIKDFRHSWPFKSGGELKFREDFGQKKKSNF